MESTQINHKRSIALRIMSVSAVVFWMFVISGFSTQNAEQSSGLSIQVSYAVVESYNSLSGAQMTSEQISAEAARLELPVRKLAHMTEYAVLAVLFLLAFLAFGKRRFLFPAAVGCCFCYALTDEFHQMFVEGRAGRFTDVLIDTAGAAIAMAVLFGLTRLFSFIKQKKKRKR